MIEVIEVMIEGMMHDVMMYEINDIDIDRSEISPSIQRILYVSFTGRLISWFGSYQENNAARMPERISRTPRKYHEI